MTQEFTPNTQDLFKAILALQNADEAGSFFTDLLTPNELGEFGRRWKAAQMLKAKYSYSKIVKDTGLSSATVARISKCITNGSGGYQLVLAKFDSGGHPVGLVAAGAEPHS